MPQVKFKTTILVEQTTTENRNLYMRFDVKLNYIRVDNYQLEYDNRSVSSVMFVEIRDKKIYAYNVFNKTEKVLIYDSYTEFMNETEFKLMYAYLIK